MVTKNRWKYK